MRERDVFLFKFVLALTLNRKVAQSVLVLN